MSIVGDIFSIKYPAILSAIILLSNSAIAVEDPLSEQINSPDNLTTSSEILAQATPETEVSNSNNSILEQINRYNLQDSDYSLEQVTNISELRDVSPGDWAFEALRNLVERYDCIEGYPNRTYRGNRALSRYEFAAGLNACLSQIERLIIETNSGVTPEDLQRLQRLVQEFEAELATLGARVDNLEGRVAFLEDHQFSTTTKLYGEVAFTLGQAFGDDVDSQVVLNDRVRLQLNTSFTGKDRLYTRLTAGNVGNSFADEIGTQEGRYAYDGQNGNNVTIDRLHYYFPLGDKLKIFTMANLGGHHFYANTFNSKLEAGGGATGALSRFAERNPIYRHGLGGQGIGLTYQINDVFKLEAGYLARGGNLPNDGAGLFNGNYSAMGQLVIQPSDKFQFGLTYLNNYDGNARRFAFGATGTDLGNLRLGSLGIADRPVSSNSYGIEAKFDLSPKFSIRGWGGFTDAKLIGFGDAEIWNYSLVLAFPDLGREGSLGAIVVGSEPYLTDLDVPGDPDFETDVPLHVEGFYKYQLTDNISITPGVIWLLSPQQDSDNSDVFIGTVRTVFTF